MLENDKKTGLRNVDFESSPPPVVGHVGTLMRTGSSTFCMFTHLIQSLKKILIRNQMYFFVF